MAENINYHLSVKNNDSNKNVLIKPHEFQNSNHKLIDIADIKFRFPGTGNDDANTIPSSNPDEFYTAGASLENCLVAFAGRDSGTGYDYKVLTIEKLANLLRPYLIFENYTIKWNINGGSSSAIADTVVSEGTAVSWPNSPQYSYTLKFKLGSIDQHSRTYTKDFNTTKSWNTKSDGTGTQVGYKGGTKTWKPTANTTVYAIWTGGTWDDNSFPTPNGLTMTWNLNGSGATIGGSNASSTQTTVNGYYYTATSGGTKKTSLPSSISSATTYYLRYDNIALPSNEPVRNGYTFKGWYTATSGGTQITTSSYYTENKTFYAQWTENAKDAYWYIGTSDPTQMSSITPKVNSGDNTSMGWRKIGTSIPTYTMANPLWNGQVNEIVFDNYNNVPAYIALPNTTIKVRDGFGNDVTSQLINKGTKTIEGITYTVYQNNISNNHTMECSLDLLVY